MATFKAVVRTPRKDGFYQVYIRVTQNTKPGYIKTDKVVTKQMVDKHGNINDPFVNEYCARMILLYTDKLNRKDCAKWTVRQIIEYVTQGDADICFSDYARHHIDRMVDRYQLRTAQNYRQALGHMERFYGTNKIMFAQTYLNADNEVDSVAGAYAQGKGDVPGVYEAGVQGCG